jgi:hypothetical protein
MAETEDIPYTLDEFTIDDSNDSVSDEEKKLSPRNALVKELRKYLKEAELEHNSFDIIDLTEAAKMTPTQQIAVHKCVVQHLRNIKGIIDNKVKET